MDCLLSDFADKPLNFYVLDIFYQVLSTRDYSIGTSQDE